jgi:hypothetical protein
LRPYIQFSKTSPSSTIKNMPERKAVLFFTNSDFGQVNVVLAVAYELLRQNKLDIHIASWPLLEPRLESLFQKVQNENPSQSISPIKFHNLSLFPGFNAWLKNRKGRKKADVPHPPGRHGADRIAQLTVKALATWEPEQHLSLFEWSADLTRHLDPALVVLDPFLIPIHDMARNLKRKYAVLSPCTLADGLIPEQPWLAAFWKYPAYTPDTLSLSHPAFSDTNIQSLIDFRQVFHIPCPGAKSQRTYTATGRQKDVSGTHGSKPLIKQETLTVSTARWETSRHG